MGGPEKKKRRVGSWTSRRYAMGQAPLSFRTGAAA